MKEALTWIKWLAASAIIFSLCACGGGGGGSSGEPSVNLAFSPNKLTINQLYGSTGRSQIAGTTDRDISGIINVGIIFDRDGVFDPTQVSVLQTGRTATANLSTIESLQPGKYTGLIEVRLCRDNPQTCASPIPGSPWKLPYEVTVVKPVVQYSPATINLDCYAGECPRIAIAMSLINADAAVQSNVVFNSYILDQAGIVTANSCHPVSRSGNTFECLTGIDVALSTAPGTYTGNFVAKFTAQKFGPPVEVPLPAVDTMIPYSITIRPASNLTPLVRWPNVEEWSQEQGNAKHSGYVPVMLDPQKFIRRWKFVDIYDGNKDYSSLVTASDEVFSAQFGFYSNGSKGSTLSWRLHEIDGQGWNDIVSSVATWGITSNIAASNGRFIFQGFISGGGLNSFLMLDSKTLQPVNSDNPPYEGHLLNSNRSITVANDRVYGEGGVFSTLNGSIVSGGLPVTSQPFAISGQMAYGFRPSQMIAANINDGSILFSITDTSISGWEIPQAGTQNDVIAFTSTGLQPVTTSTTNSRLKSYDISTHAIRWDIPLPAAGLYTPAVANGVIYLVNNNSLEARSESSGALLWNLALTGVQVPPTRSNIVATDNLIFMATTNTVYAIDISSRRMVWSETMSSVGTAQDKPVASSLAISPNGILYVSTYRGTIAYNLK